MMIDFENDVSVSMISIRKIKEKASSVRGDFIIFPVPDL